MPFAKNRAENIGAFSYTKLNDAVTATPITTKTKIAVPKPALTNSRITSVEELTATQQNDEDEATPCCCLAFFSRKKVSQQPLLISADHDLNRRNHK
ncbi:MAG: hypothetical protein P4M12_00670 [Gammaproteobacteria bacterium]|nr:hypothetical protein [Gammaproteobacteria bacterium]